jgi:hypothetical protein
VHALIVRQKMKMIASNRIAATLLIVSGFAAWLLVGPIFGDGIGGYFIGAAAFFVVSCFLPETRRVTFLSRRSALGLVGFFVWIASSLYFRQYPRHVNGLGIHLLRPTIEVALPILLGVGSYWLAVFLIRGFRAIPEYENNKGEQGASPNHLTRPELKIQGD